MKKIGILTTNENDIFTQNICQWINLKGGNAIPIYEKDLIDNTALEISFDIGSIGVKLITTDGFEINFDSIDVFYRRTWHQEIYSVSSPEHLYETKEAIGLRNLVLMKIEKVNKLIGRCSLDSNLKMKHLTTAIELGFDVPITKILSMNNEFFFNLQKSSFVIKAIESVYLKKIENSFLTNYTQELTIDQIPDKFFPALFQERIIKVVEIRTFIFFEKFYSVGYPINEATEKQHEIDTRILVAEKKTQGYPFELPKNISLKILELMKVLEIETASIDLILNEKGEFTFLDLNPFGQISMVFSSCYPTIEKEIAQKLINYEN